jgi:hypothetical protein
VPEKTAEDLARDAEQQKADEELDKAMMRIEQFRLGIRLAAGVFQGGGCCGWEEVIRRII